MRRSDQSRVFLERPRLDLRPLAFEESELWCLLDQLDVDGIAQRLAEHAEHVVHRLPRQSLAQQASAQCSDATDVDLVEAHVAERRTEMVPVDRLLRFLLARFVMHLHPLRPESALRLGMHRRLDLAPEPLS